MNVTTGFSSTNVRPPKTVCSDIEVPGILVGQVEHVIQSSALVAQYEGPPFPADGWRQVLAFLRWCFKDHHAEGQVRGYLNIQTKCWAFWAFPQENVGMSTREVDGPLLEEQRKRFKPEDGWIYFATIHSHCDSSGFQSGVDAHDEVRRIDGIHLTVGQVTHRHSHLHSRLVYGNAQQEFNPACLWEFPADVNLLFDKLLANEADRRDAIIEHIAGQLICEMPPEDQAFPDEWKANIMRRASPMTYWDAHSSLRESGVRIQTTAMSEKAKRAVDELLMDNISLDTLHTMFDNDIVKAMLRVTYRNDLSPYTFEQEINARLDAVKAQAPVVSPDATVENRPLGMAAGTMGHVGWPVWPEDTAD